MKKHVDNVSLAEMRRFRWMNGKTRRIRNDDIRDSLGPTPNEDKTMGNCLR